jgi:hypothetical protein
LKRRLSIAGVLLALVSIAFGCAEIYGLGDYTEGDASLADVVTDVATEPLPVYDGGCTCVPDVPTGWTPIAYNQAFESNCATNYGNPINVLEGITAAAASCGCTCSVGMNCNSLMVASGDSGTCNNQTSQTVPWDGGCVGITTISAGSKASIKPSGGGGCTPNATVGLPDASTANNGRLCELLVAPAPTGCSSGVCVPSAAPYVFCVHQNGVAAACPAGYPTQHVIGTKFQEGRACTQCTCDFDAGNGCGGTATLYAGGACSASSQNINADGTCQTLTGNQSLKSMTYQPSTSTASCTPSQPTPTGSVTFSDSQTVCCTQ